MVCKKTMLFASFVLFVPICFHFGNSELLAIDCEIKEFYNVNTTTGRDYRSNLESLLEVLASNGSRPSGFHNFTVGNAETAVKGLFLCRGDITATDCLACLADARPQILQICPNNTGAAIYYDECILRFSNQSIFSKLDIGYTLVYWTNSNASDTPMLNQALADAFDQITTKASRDVFSGKKFAQTETNYTEFQKMYSMVQCTPDLLSSDCESCLTTAIQVLPSCCHNRPEAIVMFPSCNVRYNTIPLNQPRAPPRPRPQSPSHPSNQYDWRNSKTAISVISILAVSVVSLVVALCCIVRKTRILHGTPYNPVAETSGVGSNFSTDSESFRCSFNQVQIYTNNFENKIGEGGFGPVYKGTLPNGTVVAVKRLSGSSSQGEQEFKNEITLVAKLRHRNLVELLGYCLEGDEKILIYEFVFNTSLDKFLFDPSKQPLLNWVTRYTIIKGLVKGFLYLHEHAPVKIIHRDLKASNVLLDRSMHAKIADFGMARLFEIEQSVINTNNFAGTFGYIAPEYARQGNISVKSDVYSLGVLILEIISGKKISNLEGFSGDDILTYAWKQHRDENSLAVMDPAIGETYNRNEVIRCIHIGLLCVVEDVGRRPDMTLISKMLDSDSILLPDPDQPAYYGRSRTRSFQREIAAAIADSRVSSLHTEACRNDVTISELHPR